MVNIYSVTTLLVIILAILLRLFVISTIEMSVPSSYSSHMKSSLTYDQSDIPENIDGKWLLKTDILSDYYQLDSIRYDYQAVVSQLSVDSNSHPPAYYFLLHTLQSSLQSGFAAYKEAYWVNFIFSCLILGTYYLLLIKHFNNKLAVLAGLILFGLSFGPLSGIVLHKAYELQALTIILIVVLIFGERNSIKKSVKHYLLIMALAFLAFIEHYFSIPIILSIFSWICIDQYLILKTNARISVLYYMLVFIGAFLSSYQFYPDMLSHLLNHYRSEEIEMVILNGDVLSTNRLKSTLYGVYRSISFIPISISALILVGSIIFEIYRSGCPSFTSAQKSILVLSIIGIFSTVILVHIGPQPNIRYGAPFIFCFYLIPSILFDTIKTKNASVIIFTILIIHIGYALYAGNRVLHDHNGTRYVKSWITVSSMNDITVNSKAIIATSKITENVRRILYHIPSNRIVLINKADLSELDFDQKNLIVWINPRLPNKYDLELTQLCKTKNFKLVKTHWGTYYTNM